MKPSGPLLLELNFPMVNDPETRLMLPWMVQFLQVTAKPAGLFWCKYGAGVTDAKLTCQAREQKEMSRAARWLCRSRNR